jgi:hypothetical protein
MERTEIQCTFSFYTFKGENYYRCVIKDQDIPEDTRFKFVGQHCYGNRNIDVVFVSFYECEISKIPQGLTKSFPNLRALEVNSSGLEAISKADLAEYKNLEIFNCRFNSIDFLPGDLFEGFNELKRIDFWNSDLELIHPHILNGLPKLEFVNFGEPDYIRQFSIYGENYSNGTLEEFKQKLFENYPYKEDLIAEVTRKQTEEDLRKQLEQQKIINAALIEQNKRLINSEAKLQNELKEEKLKNSKLTQKLEKGIIGDVSKLIQDETAKNFKIIIHEQEFPVHKFLLEARSPTLAEILRNNPEAENLHLTDISVEVFEKILKFLYTDELTYEDAGSLNLFAAAGILKIEDLKNFAAVRSTNLIKKETVQEVLLLSDKFGHEELRNNAFGEIKKYYPKIKFENSWINDVSKIIRAIEKGENRVSKIPVRIRPSLTRTSFGSGSSIQNS